MPQETMPNDTRFKGVAGFNTNTRFQTAPAQPGGGSQSTMPGGARALDSDGDTPFLAVKGPFPNVTLPATMTINTVFPEGTNSNPPSPAGVPGRG
jgi:hypothetical protein